METCESCGDPATKELNGRPYCGECWDELANGKIVPNRVVRLPAQRCVPKPPSIVREWEEEQWVLQGKELGQKARDFQRIGVYRWEWAVRRRWPDCNPAMDLRACERLVHRVWHDYRPGVQPPQVKDGRNRRVARGGRLTITLPHWACIKLVVLHETAHSLQPSLPWHGPLFTRFLADLWEHYAGVPADMAVALGVAQRPRGVQFAEYADIPTRVAAQPLSTSDATPSIVATAAEGATAA